MSEVKAGDILIFKRNGPVSAILGGILRLFEPLWDGWGWHTAFVAEVTAYKVIICEALGAGVRLTEYSRENFPPPNIRAYHWFKRAPSKRRIGQFVRQNKGKKYDVAVYFWTMAQYLLLRFVEFGQHIFVPWHDFKISLPRVLDDQYTCWELVFWFCRAMGKPVQEAVGMTATRYPMITDLERALSRPLVPV